MNFMKPQLFPSSVNIDDFTVNNGDLTRTWPVKLLNAEKLKSCKEL